MVALGNRLMQRWPVFDVVSFEDRDSVEMISEQPRCHQSCEAPTDDDGLLAEVIRHAFPPVMV